jgi:hypothetical protein
MKHVNQKPLQGRAGTVSKGFALKSGFLAIGIAICLAFTPTAKAVTQLEYLQWMVQLCGDSASFSADSTAADFIQWARTKNMNPTGGWTAGAALTPEQLAESLVQLYGLNSHKFGGDPFRQLERDGIIVDRSSREVSRRALARLFDEFGFQSRTAIIARASTTQKGNNGLGNGQDPPPPGWLNPRNPHFGQPQNDGPGNGVGNPGNRGGHGPH